MAKRIKLSNPVALSNPDLDASERRFAQLEVDSEGDEDVKPTPAQFTAYQLMFDFFNGVLFGGALPSCLLNFSRKARTGGFFAPGRWQDGQGQVAHEISLNPSQLRLRKAIDVAATLVHEMVHLWQQELGQDKPCRGYHNAEWSLKMMEVGLMPSHNGEVDGRTTGRHMTHYIIQGGAFERAFYQLPEGAYLPWGCDDGMELPRDKVKRNASKTKFTCPCGNAAWGRPGLNLVCGDCGGKFVSPEVAPEAAEERMAA